tara:strand:- start:2345 stop:2581 length:237 start_codon:yes stop_codon:yes gene_type:complete
MLPKFRPKHFVLTKHTNKISDNDVVVIKTKSNELIIKRVLDHKKDSFKVISDNKDYPSVFNNQIFSKKNIVGKVILRF